MATGNIEPPLRIKQINGSNSVTIPANSSAPVIIDLASVIPDGYRMTDINTIDLSGTNWQKLALQLFYISNMNKRVTFYYLNTHSSSVTVTVAVWIICFPNYAVVS